MYCSHESPEIHAQFVLASCLACSTIHSGMLTNTSVPLERRAIPEYIHSEVWVLCRSTIQYMLHKCWFIYLWASHMKRTMHADFCFKSWTVLSFLALDYKYEPSTVHVPRHLVCHMSSWTIHKPWILVYCCEFWTVHPRWGLHYSETLHNTHTWSAGLLFGI